MPHSLWIYTMNRCLNIFLHTAPRWAVLASLLAVAAHAEVREFPASALRGTLVVTQPPIVTMDGVQTRLSPGARIRNANNLMVLSGSLVNQSLTVNYTRDTHQLVHEVWILTAEEAALKRASAAPTTNIIVTVPVK